MDDNPTRAVVAVAWASGDLGARIVQALAAKNVSVRALVRRPIDAPTLLNVETLVVDFGDGVALTRALAGAVCVVSALNGIAPVILDGQGRLCASALSTFGVSPD